MRIRRAALLLPVLLGLGAGLAACGPSPEEQRATAERQRQLRQAQAELERCRRDQAAVQRLSNAIERSSRELNQISAARYEASARPQRPDPALAARFTQADQELDELRYRERLRAWEVAEQQRYARWLQDQSSRQDRLRVQLESDASQLRRIAPDLMAAPNGSALRPDALLRATRCRPVDFGLQDKAAAGSSSRAAAN